MISGFRGRTSQLSEAILSDKWDILPLCFQTTAISCQSSSEKCLILPRNREIADWAPSDFRQLPDPAKDGW